MQNKFKDGEFTVLAKEQTYEIDYNAAEVLDRGVAYIEEVGNSNFFLDALKRYLLKNKNKLSFTGNIDEVDDILECVNKCYREAGMIASRDKGANYYNPKVIKNWIMGDNIPSRDKVYPFCFFMKMDATETAEFLFKGCLLKPFNFKDVTESIFYFCLNTGRKYQDALRIIEKINGMPETANPYPENDTVRVGESIQAFVNEEDLISYINENKNGFKKQSRKAISILKKLVERSVKFAEWERKKEFEEHIVSKIESSDDIPAILNVILGYEARAQENGVDAYKSIAKNSKFPKLITQNFPQPQQIKGIFKEDAPSEETIRKAIILFVFYNMFAEIKMNKLDDFAGKYFDEFAAELDSVLGECGYVQMYWRHPYDWMFGYCAGAEKPLEELREVISYFYLDEDNNYN